VVKVSFIFLHMFPFNNVLRVEMKRLNKSLWNC